MTYSIFLPYPSGSRGKNLIVVLKDILKVNFNAANTYEELIFKWRKFCPEDFKIAYKTSAPLVGLLTGAHSFRMDGFKDFQCHCKSIFT